MCISRVLMFCFFFFFTLLFQMHQQNTLWGIRLHLESPSLQRIIYLMQLQTFYIMSQSILRFKWSFKPFFLPTEHNHSNLLPFNPCYFAHSFFLLIRQISDVSFSLKLCLKASSIWAESCLRATTEAGVWWMLFNEAPSRAPERGLFPKLETLMYLSSCCSLLSRSWLHTVSFLLSRQQCMKQHSLLKSTSS